MARHVGRCCAVSCKALRTGLAASSPTVPGAVPQDASGCARRCAARLVNKIDGLDFRFASQRWEQRREPPSGLAWACAGWRAGLLEERAEQAWLPAPVP